MGSPLDGVRRPLWGGDIPRRSGTTVPAEGQQGQRAPVIMKTIPKGLL